MFKGVLTLGFVNRWIGCHAHAGVCVGMAPIKIKWDRKLVIVCFETAKK